MKLYYHPVSTTSRPLMLFAAEHKLPLELQVVDLMTGEQYKPAFEKINPNHLVPVLEDGDFVLTESSAILKYLADKFDLPSYPKDLQQRAKVNEMMDWLNTQLYRGFGYDLVYPQVFPHHRRRSDEAQAGTIAWGQEDAKKWLQVLNDHWLGPEHQYLCGNEITIADYFGAGVVSIGELIGCDFSAYPNIARWLGGMKKLRSWGQVNEMFDGFVAANKGKQFARINPA